MREAQPLRVQNNGYELPVRDFVSHNFHEYNQLVKYVSIEYKALVFQSRTETDPIVGWLKILARDYGSLLVSVKIVLNIS